jgi:low affinity Fe/Cu permease
MLCIAIGNHYKFLRKEQAVISISILLSSFFLVILYQNKNTGTQSSEGIKAALGGSSRTRSSHHSGLTHNSTEKVMLSSLNILEFYPI